MIKRKPKPKRQLKPLEPPAHGARRKARPGRRPDGEIVSPIDCTLLARETITRNGRAARLELEPLGSRYREAVQWRLARILPLVAAPAYKHLWTSEDPDRRLAVLAAVFESGDYHYGTPARDRRQILARWLHRRLEGTPNGRSQSDEGWHMTL